MEKADIMDRKVKSERQDDARHQGPDALRAMSPHPPSPSSIRDDSPKGSSTRVDVEEAQPDAARPAFRLYKRRFAGAVGLFFLNLAVGMTYPWFGPIANETAADFNISLTRVNWLSNCLGIVYLPIALSTPYFTSRFGVRRNCEVGSLCLLIASWVRYAGTARSLSTNSAYALLLIGQIIAGIAQPIFQVIGPVYSELWFDTRGRTTATMVLALSNQIGVAVGQVISPAVGGPRNAVLALGIISTAIAPMCFLVGSKPPTPPTYAGSLPAPPMISLLRAWFGMQCPPESRMSIRERIDFSLIAIVFLVLVGATSTFGILTNQYFAPYGYDEDTSGYFGAVLLLVGLVSAVITAPLFDRVLTHHLALCIKICCPIIGAAWLSLIWAVRANNLGALFALFALIGACTLPLLPVGLELAVEVTRNADASSALLFFAGNAFGVISLAIEDALRLGPDADPPLSMKRAILFQGVVVLAACMLVFGIKGKQTRRERDERAATAGGAQEVRMAEVERDL